MTVYFHHYQLQPKSRPNSRVSSLAPRRGALIRVGDGFGCLHPWPELGDLPLEAHLESLREGNSPTLMAQQALRCCARDAQARKEGISLFAGNTIPPSHATLTEMPSLEGLRDLASQGFTHAKLKLDGNDAASLRTILSLAASGPLKLRLDANGTLPTTEASRWLSALDEAAEKIDFIEDPVPYDLETWTKLSQSHRIPLAVDWHPHPVPLAAASVRIFKPAAQPAIACEQPLRIITSLMDHPLGQAYAALAAAETLPPDAVCGLQTHWVYEPTAFSELLAEKGPAFRPPPGEGLGFGRLLDALDWKRLG
jgi:o-succinylbenzoate synthase